MSKVPLRRLLTRLTAIALTASPLAITEAAPNAAMTPISDEDFDAELDADIPIDREYIDPPDAAYALGRGLALAAARLRPMVATHIVSTWALSEDPVRRLAVAVALEWEFP